MTTDLLEAPGDQERRAGLRRMRFVATSLLVFAAIVYLLTLGRPAESVLGFVNTAAEAGMVGALADWFAVTALFRHPLGIPIPHTALVKRRKNELGRSLQQFVTAHFLTADVFREQLASAEIGTKVADWLSDDRNRQRVLTEATSLGEVVLRRIPDDDIRSLVDDVALPRLRTEELSPIAGAFLEGIVADDAHRGLVDLAFGEIHSWLLRHPEKFTAVVGERAPSWSPGWVDRRVVDWGYKQALEWVRNVRDTRDHPARIAIDDMLATLADDLQHDASVRRRGEALKERLLSHPGIGSTAVSLWQSVRDSLLEAMADRESPLWRRGDGWLAELGHNLATDTALRERLEARLADITGFLVERYGADVAQVISHTVERWDADQASRRIELFVGRDLQFIRINGTVVGALAGLAIHTVSVLIAPLL
ncbi:uncharacterized membrane-anchored protein YjiN (DUF445 family) [Propionibacteriaceae bacterium ES.041]|nr:uncharacterized membrane-anchored protein YjiN (DUF445 family) [Propionibacteriaceae bacterium ES.041]